MEILTINDVENYDGCLWSRLAWLDKIMGEIIMKVIIIFIYTFTDDFTFK
jgi:hypothetical protein